MDGPNPPGGEYHLQLKILSGNLKMMPKKDPPNSLRRWKRLDCISIDKKLRATKTHVHSGSSQAAPLAQHEQG